MAMRDSVRLGDILIGSGMVAADDIQRAVDLQVEKGGRLGDNLVAMGVISAEQLSWVLNSKPSAPRSMKDTGIPAGQLLKYLIKTMSATGLETPTELKSALKLPAGIDLTDFIHVVASLNETGQHIDLYVTDASGTQVTAGSDGPVGRGGNRASLFSWGSGLGSLGSSHNNLGGRTEHEHRRLELAEVDVRLPHREDLVERDHQVR